MKKNILNKCLFLLTLSGLPYSCSNELDDMAGRDEMLTVSVKTAVSASYEDIPASYATNEGGRENVDGTIYALRYTLEVWTDNASPELAYRTTELEEINAASPQFECRLPALKYKFAVWADFVLKSSVTEQFPHGTDLHYNTADLRNITFNGTYVINDEAKDAYSACADVDLRNAGTRVSMTLSRPFAKIRLVAADANTVNAASGVTGFKSKFSYGLPQLDRYDALTQKASSSGSVLYASSWGVVSPDFGTACESNNLCQTLAFDYLFVNEDEPLNMDIRLEMQNGSGVAVTLPSLSNQNATTKEIQKVPLVRNKLTTLLGNIFTPVTEP